MNQTIRDDGYLNIFTGLGTERDPISTTHFMARMELTEPQLTTIFLSDGVGRKIVEQPAEEMVRPWFKVSADKGKEVDDLLEELSASQMVTDAAVWARLYGGSIAVIVTDGGGDFGSPLRKFKSVLGIKTFDRSHVRWDVHAPSSDPLRQLSGIPEYIEVSLPNGARPIKIHESRFVYLPGLRVPELRRRSNGGWDASVLEPCYDVMLRYSTSLGYASNIMRDFVQGVLSVKGLTEMIASGREDVVTRRLRLLDLSRSILNTMVVDADGEEFLKSASSVTGIPEVIDRFVENLSLVTGIPASKLIGRTPGSLGATGESDVGNYYDMLAAERTRVVGPLVDRLVKLCYLATEGPTGGVEPEAWSIKWNPFFQPTEADIASLRKSVADTDKIYVEIGVLSPEEVAESRFGGGEWSIDTNLINETDRKAEAAGSEEDLEKSTEAAMAIKAAAPAGNEQDQSRTDATPRSLYVCRKVINGGEILAWARAQGFTELEKASELHVTITYSRSPVDWMKMGESWSPKLEISAGGPRVLETFNGDVQVLLFLCDELRWRHEHMVSNGASWDWPDYQPHITISRGAMPAGAEPYQGRIVLGPEIFEEIDETRGDEGFDIASWLPPEVVLEYGGHREDYNPDQPRDQRGRWSDGGFALNPDNGRFEFTPVTHKHLEQHRSRTDYVDATNDPDMSLYLSPAYQEINTSLRQTGDFPDHPQIGPDWGERFDGKFSEHLSDEVVYRGAQSLSPDQLRVGAVFQDAGYVSTSTHPSVPIAAIAENTTGGAQTLFRVTIPKGTQTLVTNADQQEIVIARGQKYRVVSFGGAPRFVNEKGAGGNSAYVRLVDLEVVR